MFRSRINFSCGYGLYFDEESFLELLWWKFFFYFFIFEDRVDSRVWSFVW